MPRTNSQKLISCSSGGDIYLTDVTHPTLSNSSNHFQCHGDKSCYEIRTFPQDPSIFVTCGQDGSCKWVDTRLASKCERPFCKEHTLLKAMTGISAITLNPVVPYHLVCAGLDGVIRMYDRRVLSVGSGDDGNIRGMVEQSVSGMFACFSAPEAEQPAGLGDLPSAATNLPPFVNNKRVTSVQYDNRGNDLLVSYHSNNIYLLDWRVI